MSMGAMEGLKFSYRELAAYESFWHHKVACAPVNCDQSFTRAGLASPPFILSGVGCPQPSKSGILNPSAFAVLRSNRRPDVRFTPEADKMTAPGAPALKNRFRCIPSSANALRPLPYRNRAAIPCFSVEDKYPEILRRDSDPPEDRRETRRATRSMFAAVAPASIARVWHVLQPGHKDSHSRAHRDRLSFLRRPFRPPMRTPRSGRSWC